MLEKLLIIVSSEQYNLALTILFCFVFLLNRIPIMLVGNKKDLHMERYVAFKSLVISKVKSKMI